VNHLLFASVESIVSILKEKKMLPNQFNENDDDLQNHSKDSLIRIISYWKGRAKSLEDQLSDKEDELYVERSDWDE
jgi:hypothetical protein